LRIFSFSSDDYRDDFEEFRWALGAVVFAMGILASAIFTAAEDREIEGLEKGLVDALMCRPSLYKES